MTIKTCSIWSAYFFPLMWQHITAHKCSHNSGHWATWFSHHSSPSLQSRFGAERLQLVHHLKKTSQELALLIEWWIEGSCVAFLFHFHLSEFYETGIWKLILRWLRCIKSDSEYVEMKHSKWKLILSTFRWAPWYFPTLCIEPAISKEALFNEQPLYLDIQFCCLESLTICEAM